MSIVCENTYFDIEMGYLSSYFCFCNCVYHRGSVNSESTCFVLVMMYPKAASTLIVETSFSSGGCLLNLLVMGDDG
jgi:hypothetical protein